MASGYSIADEPRPGGLSQAVVNPIWPLLAFMLAGTWFGWAWFILNGAALGSATRRRELALVVGGLVGTWFIMAFLFSIVDAADAQSKTGLRLSLLVVTLWKLSISYLLYMYQERGFAIYEYYGGAIRNGLPFAILGLFVGHRILGMVGNDMLRLILQ